MRYLFFPFNYARKLLFPIWNKQFLAFAFFLLLSTSFWFFQTLNETYDREFSLPIRLIGIPENVIITTPPPSHLRVTLRDRGFMLLRYQYISQLPTIVLRWDEICNNSGQITLSSTELLKNTNSALEASTQAINIRPEKLDIYFNHGQSKELPVVVQGIIEADSAYSIIAIDIEPRHIKVFSSPHILDTLTAAYLRSVELRNLIDTTTLQQKFIRIPGVKYVPQQVNLRIFADRMIEKKVEVPIQGVNFPADKTLRTFPSKATVTFQVAMSQYRKVTAENFVIVVNYEKLLNNIGNTCKLMLKSIPYGTRAAKISPAEVEYIIEQTTEEAPI